MVAQDCIFCKIANGEIPSTKIYEDADLVAFDDIHPAAPVHFLVVPKRHIETLDDVDESCSPLMGKMLVIATHLAREKGISKDGYREVINCRRAGGQIIFHLHMHVLGGRTMQSMG